MIRKRFSSPIWILLCFFSVSFIGCVEPVNPDFDLKEGLVYIDAFVSTAPGASYATISETAIEFQLFVNKFISGAEVSFRNTDTGLTVLLTEQEGTYLPPNDFTAAVGDSWELLIVLPNGKSYKSLPEQIKQPVEISDIKATFNPELLFRESADGFIPGHFISIDIDDPVDEENFYFWKYRSFEKILTCESCDNSIFRNGKCSENPYKTGNDYVVEYSCDGDCWQIRSNENIKLFDDKFTNGTRINSLPVADVLLYSKENIVVHLQQFSLSATAYQYFKILKDIVDNAGSFNAPPPAALIGNMFNSEDSDEFVLGRFTAAAATTRIIFIDRENVAEPFIRHVPTAFETCGILCPPSSCPPSFTPPACNPILLASCTETRFKTAIAPEGWVN